MKRHCQHSRRVTKSPCCFQGISHGMNSPMNCEARGWTSRKTSLGNIYHLFVAHIEIYQWFSQVENLRNYPLVNSHDAGLNHSFLLGKLFISGEMARHRWRHFGFNHFRKHKEGQSVGNMFSEGKVRRKCSERPCSESNLLWFLSEQGCSVCRKPAGMTWMTWAKHLDLNEGFPLKSSLSSNINFI